MSAIDYVCLVDDDDWLNPSLPATLPPKRPRHSRLSFRRWRLQYLFEEPRRYGPARISLMDYDHHHLHGEYWQNRDDDGNVVDCGLTTVDYGHVASK